MLNPNTYKTKRYIHFDRPVKIENAEAYLINQEKIALHSFLPLIHYITSFSKNIGKANPDMNYRPIKEKKRAIMYAGHLDNFIYKYYADELLNKAYNKFVLRNDCPALNIDTCITAYRNNKYKQSNSNFAAEIINEIVYLEDAYIVVGDFTGFFDNIDHKLLKENLLTVLQVDKLSDDWYNVYRSVTKYGYYEKSLLAEMFGTDKQIRRSRKKSYFHTLQEFRDFQKKFSTKKNEKDGKPSKKGIPQGTAISAVFANVYALKFDWGMKMLADTYSGVYRRYSDDFILVIPREKNECFLSEKAFFAIESEIRCLAKQNKIEINEEKTDLYLYNNSTIYNLKEQITDHLDYLGFIFDGKTVRMRGKSTYKFYRNAYKLINKAKKIKHKKSLKKLPYRKKIYSLYTDLGKNQGDFGNFIKYAQRSQDIFDELSPHTHNMMMNQIKNRKKKIEKKLGVKIHTKL